MAQKAHVPKFGNWQPAGAVPYTQYFDQARKAKEAGKFINPNDPDQLPEAYAKAKPPVNAPLFIAQDARPLRKDPVREEGIARRTSPDIPREKKPKVVNSGGQSPAGKPPGRSAPNSPLPEKPANVRNPGGQRPDVVVPPFPNPNDTTSGEKYTDIFNVIAGNRSGIPYNGVEPVNNRQENNETRGCGCLSCLFK